MTSIVTSILCLDEKLDIVSGYVLCLGQLLQQGLEAGPQTAEILLNTLTESQKDHTYDFYSSPDSTNSKSTFDPHAGEFIPKSREVFESSWEPLESSHIDLDGKVSGFSVTAGVDGETDIPDTTVPSHHIALVRDCDVKPLMTNNDGHSGIDTNIEGSGDMNIEGKIGIEGAENIGVKGANKIDVEKGCQEDPDVETRRVWRGRPRETTRFVHADSDRNEAADRKGQLANRGQAAKVKFYEVGLGTERTLEHSELQPLGELLERYCTTA